MVGGCTTWGPASKGHSTGKIEMEQGSTYRMRHRDGSVGVPLSGKGCLGARQSWTKAGVNIVHFHLWGGRESAEEISQVLLPKFYFPVENA